MWRWMVLDNWTVPSFFFDCSPSTQIAISTCFNLGFCKCMGFFCKCNVLTLSVGGLGHFQYQFFIFSPYGSDSYVMLHTYAWKKLISLSLNWGRLVSWCLWSSGRNVGLFGNALLYKTHRASGEISPPVCVNPRDKYDSLYLCFALLFAVWELPILDGDVKFWDSVDYICTCCSSSSWPFT